MDRFDPFVKYADVYGEIINWEKDPMNKPQNQNKYFFSDGKTYYEQICKMLRLMSVFKQAFNQIYDNEDEIHNAWENFVNNLSASAVIGTEPDVTLTWNDGSVNFEFTMVPGEDGQDGVGITSISFNSDYTMTITLSNGQTYTSMSLKGDTGATGETGPQGPQGAPGEGLKILDVYPTLNDLQTAHPTGQPGDAYQVGSAESYTLYIWSSSQSAWVPAGSLGAVSPSLSNPLMDGTASAGSQNLYSRGDHVHPTDTSRASQEELDALIKTSQALIDQSFTYRESPAIQNGLARFDKIKGNTLVWNQHSDTITPGTASKGLTMSRKTGVDIPTIHIEGTYNFQSGDDVNFYIGWAVSRPKFAVGHKILVLTTMKNFGVGTYTATPITYTGEKSALVTITQDGYLNLLFRCKLPNGSAINEDFTVNVFDLTQMGLDITDPSEFTSLFPLSYYAYESGTLLPFKGEGIKTVGFNQWDEELEQGFISTSSGLPVSSANYSRSKNFIPFLPQKSYYFKANYNVYVFYYDGNKNYLGFGSSSVINKVFTSPYSNAMFIKFKYDNGGADYENDVCINISSSENGKYEPYTESTTSLPISTYFPQGMNRVNDVYDELTPSKAVKRLGMVDLGTLTWEYQSNVLRYRAIAPTDIKPVRGTITKANVVCPIYETSAPDTMYVDTSVDMLIGIGTVDGISYIYVRDLSYTDATAFKSAMNGVYLVYELSEYEETPITPSLDLTFNAYERGTEELLPVNGSVPVTSPIIADMTYMSIDDVMTYILNKLDGIPSEIVQKLSEMESDISALEDDVSALQTASSELETDVETLSATVNGLSGTVMSHTNSISTINTDISGIQADMVLLDIGVTGANRRIGLLETADTRIEGKADANTAEITAIKTGLVKSVARTLNINDVTASGTLDSNSAIDVETGYTFLGIIGTRLTHSGDNEFSSYMLDIEMIEYYLGSNDTPRVRYKIRNFSATDISGVRLYLTMLCVKTS